MELLFTERTLGRRVKTPGNTEQAECTGGEVTAMSHVAEHKLI